MVVFTGLLAKKYRHSVRNVARVLVASIALGSSIYAWFAMNTTVTATAMTVNAKSNSQYLLIGDDHDKAAASTKTDAADVALTNSHDALYADSATNAEKKFIRYTIPAAKLLNFQEQVRTLEIF